MLQGTMMYKNENVRRMHEEDNIHKRRGKHQKDYIDMKVCLILVADVCNLSYSGGRDQEYQYKAIWRKQFKRPYL
jgi:hypothetical protein